MIRKYQDKDLNEVMNCWLKTNIEAHNFISHDYWLKQVDLVKSLIPQAEVFVEEEAGNIQGFIGIVENYVAGLFVIPSAQSKGIGTSLLNRAKEEKSTLSLSVYEKNKKAVQFYRKAGFQIETQKWDDSTQENELIMSWVR